MNETYNVCHSCAIVLTNGETDHIHPYLLPNVLASTERLGPVAQIKTSADHLIFICDCCGGRVHSKIHRYENLL